MKQLFTKLPVCTLCAATYDPEIKEYYQRKVAEGKNKMLVINNVRNKLIHRVCACIREDKMYEKRIVA